MGSEYLCYDIRGIQSFIFAVPRLRYIVGGSAVIDRFDRVTALEISKRIPGVELIAAGGGRGMYRVESEGSYSNLVTHLRGETSTLGLDLWTGRGPGFQAAGPTAEALYSFLPAMTGGHPCPVSGLYPTVEAHKPCGLIQARLKERDRLEDWVISQIGPLAEKDPGLSALRGLNLAIPRDVSGAEEETRAQAKAFGGSGRWAVLAMDGNGIGRQHASMASKAMENPDEYSDWLKAMSRSLDACTRESFVVALTAMIKDWLSECTDNDGPRPWEMAVLDGQVFLPVRPLIIGGDDLVCLIHPRFAFDFARALAVEFENRSVALARKCQIDLWPATGGRLTISAGLLFARTTYPLHAAIRYAEELLSSAKHFRHSWVQGEPSPAAIDWESITEGMMDSPADRRRRDLVFFDKDINEEVCLTGKPYAFPDIEKLRAASALDDIPRSILTGLHQGLRAPFWDRFAYRARLAKRQPELAAWLEENPEPGDARGQGWRCEATPEGGNRRTQVLLDILALREEHRRSLRVRMESS